MFINSVKETCFSQKYPKWIYLILELLSSIGKSKLPTVTLAFVFGDTLALAFVCIFLKGRINYIFYSDANLPGKFREENQADDHGSCQR